jgi:hypothetical protein
MSTIKATNLANGTDTVTTDIVINGSARSFLTHNFSNGISESFNTSSVADVSTGVGRQVYTSAMNITAHTTLGNAQGGAHNTTFLFCEITNVTTSQIEWNTGTSASNGVNLLGDNTTCHAALGDLA